MVLLGIKSTHLTSVMAHDRYCAGCNSYDTIVLNVFQKQIHLLDFPVFPIGKTGHAFCKTCKTTIEEEAMSEFIRHEYLLLKNEVKGLSWQISGSLLLLGFTLALSLSHKKTNQKELKYLSSPQRGDVYEYQTNTTEYSTMKINKVSADSLYVLFNRHKVDTPSNLNWIDKAENYKENTVAFERQKINDMYNEGKIFAINRSR